MSSVSSDRLWDASTSWVESTCGEFNSLEMIQRSTNPSLKGLTADDAVRSKEQRSREGDKEICCEGSKEQTVQNSKGGSLEEPGLGQELVRRRNKRGLRQNIMWKRSRSLNAIIHCMFHSKCTYASESWPSWTLTLMNIFPSLISNWQISNISNYGKWATCSASGKQRTVSLLLLLRTPHWLTTPV